MRNKTFLRILLVFCVLAASAAVGFFSSNLGPLALQEEASNPAVEQQAGPIVLPEIPDTVFQEFAQEFSVVRGASENMTLPNVDLLDPDGKSFRIDSFKGKLTLVNFWATWCAPCVVELPSLQKLAEHYKNQMNVVAVSLDPMKKHSDILAFLENRKISTFAGYFDDKGALGAELGLRGIPTSFLLGKNGQILYRFEGDADWASPAAQKFFDSILKETTPQKR